MKTASSRRGTSRSWRARRRRSRAPGGWSSSFRAASATKTAAARTGFASGAPWISFFRRAAAA
eukprot:3581094-Lingulodinium_polyedra.AAC.1